MTTSALYIRRYVLGPLRTNVYIVCCGSQAIIIDAAPGSYPLLKEIMNLAIRVDAILITHGHFDHVASAQRIKNLLGSRIYMHRLDERILRISKSIANMYGTEWYDPEVDIWLDGGEEFNIGSMTIKVIHTPGHTPGSVCYLVNNELLFTGDTLFRGTIGRTDFPESSPSDMTKSLRKIFSLPDDIKVYPGHGECTTLQYERKNNPYIKRFV